MEFKVGDAIGGRFLVEQVLGSGAVGVVYLVADKNRGERVALKVLKPELSKQKLPLQRFMNEVKTVRKIAHKGIVPVYETGRLGDTLFYTMEWVRGDDIRKIIRREKKIDPAKAIEATAAVCEILEEVHQVLVHRDIAPDNIMIQDDGNVRLLDFGTARLMESDSQLTRVGMHVGKTFYSAPEQRSDAHTVDKRADLYALGVLLYEMISGELVIAYQPITEYCPELSPEYDAFLEKAMAKSPDDRYQSAAEFRTALLALPVLAA